RSYYMTFTGEYRGGHGHEEKERKEDPHGMAAHAHGAADAAAPVHQHDASHGAQEDDHAHEHVPRESPKSMAVVLQILAVAAVVAGVIFGWPAAWPPHGHEP